MTPKAIHDELPITVEGACNISLECWRLSRIAESLKDSSEGMALRHATRSINEALNAIGIEIVDFAGRIYDPGMVPEVVEVRLDDTLPDRYPVIAETIAPTVTWRGQVVKLGQIVVKRSPPGLSEIT
jgi:hypothetical protein